MPRFSVLCSRFCVQRSAFSVHVHVLRSCSAFMFCVHGSLMQTTINGQPYSCVPGDDETALELVRDRLRLTGSKPVCGHGACGACTMHLDAAPVAACILPAHALEGHTVRTIEGLGPTLHPIQRAFMAHDALQCGFCTPGFVMSGVAFFERWRRQHGPTMPSRDEVARALEGNLCRCGAYAGIYAAVQAACAGRFEDEDPAPPRHEARAKVTGQARYTIDVLLPGQLEGIFLRSPHPHARIRRIDSTKAAKLPGVRALIGFIRPGQLVRYIGQEVLAIAATSRAVAEAALAHVVIEYEVLPAAIGLDAARDPTAPLVYTSRWGSRPKAAETPTMPTRWRGNVRGPTGIPRTLSFLARRRIRVARQKGNRGLVEKTYRTAPQSHTAFEPHVCVANWQNEQLTVYLSTQSCDALAEAIAKRWQRRRDRVQVVCEHVGGGFGAKLDVGMEAIAAIELSRRAHAPVRVALTRAEELLVGGYRPGSEVHIALLGNPRHGLDALDIEAYTDAGIAIGSSAAAMGMLTYLGLARGLRDYDVVSHLPPGRPFRGPGGPVVCWALEQAVDEAAHRLNADPLELRRRWDLNPLRHALYDWAAQIPAWRNRQPVAHQRGRIRRGIGVAAANWYYFIDDATKVELSVGPNGLIAVCATQDMGNGTRSVIAQVIAQVFGLAPQQIQVLIGDSRFVHGPMAAGSRSTASVAPAAIAAAEQLRSRLLTIAREQFGLQRPNAVRGGIRHLRGFTPWAQLFAVVTPFSVTGQRHPDRHGYRLPFPVAGMRIGRGFTGGVHMAEVEVDTLLGRVRVLRVWGGFAAGRIHTPDLARSQAYGGIIQGIGFALYEERQVDPQSGLLLSANLEDYHIPGIGDTPEMEIYFYERGFEHVPGGGVGLGEVTTLAVAAAIGNAVFHATGWRSTDLPIRPDRVLTALR